MIPFETPELPDVVARLAGGAEAVAVWQNEDGGITFRIPGHHVKWQPSGVEIDLSDEVARLRWASQFTAVPPVVELGADERGSWLVTTTIPGKSAVDPRWIAEPETAIPAIGVALRQFHDALPVDECPFSWRTEERIAHKHEAAEAGRLDPADWRAPYNGLSLDEAMARVADTPPVDRLVVCHGDACAPNTLIGDDGIATGHVDLGALGVADRWADLAVITMSLSWNYGAGWDATFYDAYGIDRDREREAYFRLLWEIY